jgi:mannan endo-1,4-beta-mannosidase
MKSMKALFTSAIFLCFAAGLFAGPGLPIKPVTPKPSPEAKALLNFFYSISGKYTLSGQHNYPNIKDRNTRFASEYIGKTPVIFSTDWGFAKENDKDSYLARPEIVKEAIRQHRLGSIITICWHAVPPTAREPITFQPVPGENPPALASVQGQLTDPQFRDILTPGTQLYKSWCAQVDSVAHYLRLLQDAHVPVLWRPYHEMNGSWFWWGGRTGKCSTQALYRQLFNRLVKYHKLNNLIWMWSVDRPTRPEMKFTNFYPGNDYLDILSLDVYGSDFNQAYYDSLKVLSQGKPLVLAEVGNPPSPEILEKQPLWGYYSTWAGMVRNTLKKDYDRLMHDPRILNLEDPLYMELSRQYHDACGLTLIVESPKAPADFSGKWVFDEERSILDNSGTGNIPYRIETSMASGSLKVKKVIVHEEEDATVTEEELPSVKNSAPGSGDFSGTTTMKRSENGDTLKIESKMSFKRGNQTFESSSSEKWYLSGNKRSLFINQASMSVRGKRNVTLVYDKE